jgi:mRNA-degrading endonuclease RelE of RelBE toxin-antitoxin system
MFSGKSLVTNPKARIRIAWTETAKQGLKELPKDIQIGLLDAIEVLQTCDNPTTQYKRLAGPLKGLNRVRYSRYRAIFSTTKDVVENGETILTHTVMFLATGIRKEKSKKDIYFVAKKLVDKGIFIVTS